MSKWHDTTTKASGGRWQALRKQALERDGYRCQQCGKPGRLEADHVIPLMDGGAAWDPDNIQALCVSCHLQKTRLERATPQSPSRIAWASYLEQLSRRFDGEPV